MINICVWKMDDNLWYVIQQEIKKNFSLHFALVILTCFLLFFQQIISMVNEKLFKNIFNWEESVGNFKKCMFIVGGVFLQKQPRMTILSPSLPQRTVWGQRSTFHLYSLSLYIIYCQYFDVLEFSSFFF